MKSAEKVVGVIDYQMGNLQSVLNAFDSLRVQTKAVTKDTDLSDVTHLVLPGVGAFTKGMHNLNHLGLVPLIRDWVETRKKPFLGICLGMQLLADTGNEGGITNGLGLIPGRVERLPEAGFPIPHIGWNDVASANNSPLTEKLSGESFYFVHSYYFIPKHNEHNLAVTDYGSKFCSIVGRENCFGVQFHPEKSQSCGINLLKNFLNC